MSLDTGDSQNTGSPPDPEDAPPASTPHHRCQPVSGSESTPPPPEPRLTEAARSPPAAGAARGRRADTPPPPEPPLIEAARSPPPAGAGRGRRASTPPPPEPPPTEAAHSPPPAGAGRGRRAARRRESPPEQGPGDGGGVDRARTRVPPLTPAHTETETRMGATETVTETDPTSRIPTTPDGSPLKGEQQTGKTRREGGPDCAICLQSCVHPVQLPCQHIFCFLCAKGAIKNSRRCAMCRSEVAADYLERPLLLDARQLQVEMDQAEGYQWFYEGRNGWWKYDERTAADLETAFTSGEKRAELLVAGYRYVVDFEAMLQLRRSDPARRRRVKRDLASAAKKGVAGLRVAGAGTEVEGTGLEAPLRAVTLAEGEGEGRDTDGDTQL